MRLPALSVLSYRFLSMESLWATRDLPVLRALVEYFDAIDAYRLQVGQIAEMTGMAEDAVKRALRDLWDAEPRPIKGMMVDQAPYPVLVTGVTEQGRRMVGAWPNPQQLTERLLDGFERAIAAEPDEQQRTRLRRAFDTLGGITREVLVQVAANAITG